MFGVSALVCIHVLAVGLDLLFERLFIMTESRTGNCFVAFIALVLCVTNGTA